jgi:DNA gyrase subunit A
MEKTGNLVGVKAVGEEDEMMLITTEGTVIRIKVKDTALSGRITSGVKLINLDKDVEVASISKVRKDENMEEDDDLEMDEEQDKNNDSAENKDESVTSNDNSDVVALAERAIKAAEEESEADDSDEE